MASSSDDDRSGRERGKSCLECGAARALDQRYCLECGARLGFLPTPVAALVGRVAAVAKSVAARVDVGREDRWPQERSSFMPSPRAAATAVIGMLALGVAIGSATDQIAQSAGLETILLESSPPPPPEEAEAPERPSAEPEFEEAAGEPVAARPALPEEAPPPEQLPPKEHAPKLEIPEDLPTGPPEVKHVFLIVLGENGYEETFGKASQSPFVGKELPAQGELLSNYFAVASGELANEIALISGQGPTPETTAGCPNYSDVLPGTESAEGQVEGNGCVYPATTKTLTGQLTEKGLKWRAYVGGIEAGAAAGQPTSCRHPQPGTADPNHTATAADPYLTWRNPFVYFHSILDAVDCPETDVGLPQLTTDLQLKPEKFPALAYIAPDACQKGGEIPCEPNQPVGPAATEEFLKTVVGQIKESLAYKDGGLIVITSAQARQGDDPDTRSCCISPAYPNIPPAPEEAVTGPIKESGGGGQVGLLLISPFVEPGTTSDTYFNHYSLLVTIEELFGLERIGYAAEPAITGFDASIFNAGS